MEFMTGILHWLWKGVIVEMIIIKVMGGLGNQMQQYALYEKFRSMGKEAKLDISWFEDSVQQEHVLARRELELRLFEGLEFETCTPGEKRVLLGRGDFLGKIVRKINPKGYLYFQESDMYHPEIFSFTDRYLEGHWACEKYYQDILPVLRKKIRFPHSDINRQYMEKELNSQVIDNGRCENQIIDDYRNGKQITDNKTLIIEKIINKSKDSQKNIGSLNAEIRSRMESENSVSIHIRRGDYLDPVNARMFGGICTEEYYNAAEQYIRERVRNARFYLFSDDTAYLKEKYHGSEYTVIDWNKGRDSFYDMELMSCCKHNICANSTFSFWGARLNGAEDKIMIRPSKHKNSQTINPVVMQELWENWVLIDEKGSLWQ